MLENIILTHHIPKSRNIHTSHNKKHQSEFITSCSLVEKRKRKRKKEELSFPPHPLISQRKKEKEKEKYNNIIYILNTISEFYSILGFGLYGMKFYIFFTKKKN